MNEVQKGFKTTQDCLQIFQYILDTQPLTCEFILKQLKIFLQSETLCLFLPIEDPDKWMCSYSTRFSNRKIFPFEDISSFFDGGIFITKNNENVCYMLLKSKIIYNSLDSNIKKMVNDIICIGIMIITFTDNKYKFIQHMCFSLSQLVDKITRILDNLVKKNEFSPSVQQQFNMINKNLGDIMNIAYDAIDYIKITENKIKIEEDNVIDIAHFFNETIQLATSISENTVIEKYLSKTMPTYMLSDKKNLQQLFILLFKKIGSNKLIIKVKEDLLVDEKSFQHLIVNIINQHGFSNLFKKSFIKFKNMESNTVVTRLNPIKFENCMFLKLCELLKVKVELTDNELVLV
ncbi:hypothetical protein HDU92_008029 [Lobulomyces angularis]|nr:hypothetical protein HDU92_008029 [Lobulomyces angularis]